MAPPVRLRAKAVLDIEEATSYYRSSAGPSVASRLLDVIEHELNRLRRSPGIGSMHFALDLGIPHLRAWPLRDFPYVLFYVEASDVIDVWRLLHSGRDLPAAVTAP